MMISPPKRGSVTLDSRGIKYSLSDCDLNRETLPQRHDALPSCVTQIFVGQGAVRLRTDQQLLHEP